MAKTLAEIEKALQERYDGPTKEKNGFTYIPWNESVKAANRVFGIDGYSIEILKVARESITNDIEGNTTHGYTATVRVTVFPTDSKPFFRDGVGFNELEFAKAFDYEDKKTHQQVHVPPRALTDTAIKGAASDGANRAFKLFGDAFGLYLYDKDDEAHNAAPKQTYAPRQGTDTVAPRQSSGGAKDYPPSAGQLKFLASLGYTDEDIAGMSYREWKPILDNKTRKAGTQPAAKPAAKAPATPAPTFEDIPDDGLPF